MGCGLQAVQKLIAGIFVVTICAQAMADNKADAKKHFKAGNALYLAEDYAGAAVEFEESVRLYPNKNGLFNLANCYKALHRYGEALAVLARLKKELGHTLDDEIQEKAEQLAQDMRAIVAKLEIRVSPSGATVVLDGREVGTSPIAAALIVGPGEHEIVVSLEGHETERRVVRLVSGESREAVFSLEETATVSTAPPANIAESSSTQQEQHLTTQPESAAEPKPSHDSEVGRGGLSPWFWVGLAGTVATGATAGVFLGMAANKHDDLKGVNNDLRTLNEDPNDADYDADFNSLHSDGEKAADKTDLYSKLAIGFGIGAGAFAVLTIVALSVDLSGGESEKPEVSAAPGGIVVRF